MRHSRESGNPEVLEGAYSIQNGRMGVCCILQTTPVPQCDCRRCAALPLLISGGEPKYVQCRYSRFLGMIHAVVESLNQSYVDGTL